MKEKVIRILKIGEIAVSVLLFSLIFFSVNNIESGLILPDSIKYLPIVIFSIFILLFIVDFILKESRIRAIIYYIEILSLMGMAIQKEYLLANSFLMIIGLPNAIIALVSYIRDIQGKNDIKPLPIGYYSNFHFYSILVFLFFAIGAITVTYFLLEKYRVNIAYIFISIPIMLILTIVIMVKTNPLVKALKAINVELNYEKFTKLLDSIVSNNLNPESRAFLEAIRANYMLLINKKEALNYYETIGVVTNKFLIVQYATIKANFASMKHDDNEFKNAISLINTYSPRKASLLTPKLDATWNVFNSKNEIENAEQIFNVFDPMPVLRIINKDILMYYYDTRGYKDKALIYANELKDCPFDEYKNYARKVLNGEENEKQEIVNN